MLTKINPQAKWHLMHPAAWTHFSKPTTELRLIEQHSQLRSDTDPSEKLGLELGLSSRLS